MQGFVLKKRPKNQLAVAGRGVQKETEVFVFLSEMHLCEASEYPLLSSGEEKRGEERDCSGEERTGEEKTEKKAIEKRKGEESKGHLCTLMLAV